MMNERISGVYVDVAQSLKNDDVFMLAEAILFRLLQILGVRLKNLSLGTNFMELITRMDTSKWDAITFKLVNDIFRR